MTKAASHYVTDLCDECGRLRRTVEPFDDEYHPCAPAARTTSPAAATRRDSNSFDDSNHEHERFSETPEGRGAGRHRKVDPAASTPASLRLYRRSDSPSATGFGAFGEGR